MVRHGAQRANQTANRPKWRESRLECQQEHGRFAEKTIVVPRQLNEGLWCIQSHLDHIYDRWEISQGLSWHVQETCPAIDPRPRPHVEILVAYSWAILAGRSLQNLARHSQSWREAPWFHRARDLQDQQEQSGFWGVAQWAGAQAARRQCLLQTLRETETENRRTILEYPQILWQVQQKVGRWINHLLRAILQGRYRLLRMPEPPQAVCTRASREYCKYTDCLLHYSLLPTVQQDSE